MEKTGKTKPGAVSGPTLPGHSWRVLVNVDDIPDTGRHIEIEAPDAVRAELARFAEVRDLPRLSASFDLTRIDHGIYVSGHVRALVGQNCVVTLDPIETEIEEPVELMFEPLGEGEVAKPPSARQRPVAGDDEPPEPLVDGIVDLGAIAVEFMILGIDPYPRKAGAEFAAPEAENGARNPFAALAALKNTPDGSKS